MDLKGLGVAMITPFTQEGTIDFDAIPLIVENITTGRADYIVLMGTTAESSCLSAKEKQQVIQMVVEINNDRLPLVIGIGGNNTANT